ncbi:MAG: GAF domain-containing protein [Verrucomicrobia bacterium]|nr:GAF domain-containing protein [Verrucomicrobiota bacterium]
MKTALLLTDSPETQRLLSEIVGDNTHLVLLPVPVDPTREKFDALFAMWLRLSESVIVDAVSLGEASRWAIESLAAASARERQAVVVRATAQQQSLYPIQPDWLVVSEKDGYDQLKQSLTNYFNLRQTQSHLKRANDLIARQRNTTGGNQPCPARPAGAAPVGSAFDLYQYRDALKSVTRVLGQHLDDRTLLVEFFQLVRELLGVAKLVIFMRPVQTDLFQGHSGPVGQRLSAMVNTGISPEVAEHFRLTVDGGIGGLLSREPKILHRAKISDTLGLDYDQQAAREFDLLGTEIAVPILDNDQLLGVLTFSGKVTGEPLRNEDLELVFHLMTHLAQAVRNLHLLNQVAGQRRFMSEVLANVHSGVIVIGQDGHVLSINPRARDLLDLGDKPLVGRAAGGLPSRVADAIFESLQTGREVRFREIKLPPSNRVLSISAARFTVNLSGAEADAGSLVAVGMIDDLTQVKIQETQARELADKEFFMRLAFRLSHELANAMVSVKTFAQLLPERADEPEFCEQFGREVISDVKRMDTVINTLAFFAQPLELVYEDANLAEVVEACMRSIGPEFSRKQTAHVVDFSQKAAAASGGPPMVVVQKTFNHHVPRVQADRIRLIQAFEHLVRNAVQAMPQGGKLSISTSDAQPSDFPDGGLPAGGAVKIEFQDTGVGIALDRIQTVTEPFVTARNVGIGLGLTIVKKIVEEHSGRLAIDSILGRSTTVAVILPASATPRSPRGAETEDARIDRRLPRASGASSAADENAPHHAVPVAGGA